MEQPVITETLGVSPSFLGWRFRHLKLAASQLDFPKEQAPFLASISMRIFVKLIGSCLLLYSIYLLGHNIIFTTNVSPYWWRGIAADAAILFLSAGVLSLVFLPTEFKEIGWVSMAIGIVMIFMSSRAILNPTSLWEFFLAFMVMAVGYKLFSTGRVPLL